MSRRLRSLLPAPCGAAILSIAMTDGCHDRQALLELSSALESLRQSLRGDLHAIRQLPEQQIEDGLRDRWFSSRARADMLLRRLEQLRQVAEVRLRALQRLRARMHQLRGGTWPH